MLVRIEAVISTAGNNEEYFGRVLGQEILGRPLTRMVVTFEEELTDEEFTDLRGGPIPDTERRIRDRMASIHAIKVHSIRITRNFQH